MMRGLVLKQYCYYGNKDAITEAQRRFAAHVEKSSLIPSDLKDLVFSTCMANGNDETFDQLIKVGYMVTPPIDSAPLISFMTRLMTVMSGVVSIVYLEEERLNH